MVVGPWEMVYPVVDFRVRVSCALRSEFKNGPVFPMLAVQKGDELIQGIAVSFLGPYRAGSGCDDD